MRSQAELGNEESFSLETRFRGWVAGVERSEPPVRPHPLRGRPARRIAMDKELIDRAEMIRKRILQLRDSL